MWTFTNCNVWTWPLQRFYQAGETFQSLTREEPSRLSTYSYFFKSDPSFKPPLLHDDCSIVPTSLFHLNNQYGRTDVRYVTRARGRRTTFTFVGTVTGWITVLFVSTVGRSDCGDQVVVKI